MLLRGENIKIVALNKDIMAKIIISNSAFLHMVASCLEVYKRETCGILLGTKSRNYNVRYSFSYQSAERMFTSVEVGDEKFDMMRKSMKFLSGNRIIGDFHSHTGKIEATGLSEEDIKDIKKYMHSIEIVLMINKTEKTMKWKHNADKSISGTIGRGFFLKIYGYEFNKKKKRILKLKVSVPYIKKLNRLLKKRNKKRK